jgi:hypothetical protein
MEIVEVPWGWTCPRDLARYFADWIRSGAPAEVTVLCRNSTETRWFQELAGLATAICLLKGREPKTGKYDPLQGQVTLYFGSDIEGFVKAWAHRGLSFRWRSARGGSQTERAEITVSPEPALRPSGGGSSNYLLEEQLAEMRSRQDANRAVQAMWRIRDLARDLHEGRVPAADPDVRAALAELATAIIRALSAVG